RSHRAALSLAMNGCAIPAPAPWARTRPADGPAGRSSKAETLPPPGRAIRRGCASCFMGRRQGSDNPAFSLLPDWPMTTRRDSSWLERSAPVAAAQAAGRPVVALESTIIAHGMPWPHNVRTAREVEALIRGMGAEPATIAVMDGRIRIGLDDA